MDMAPILGKTDSRAMWSGASPVSRLITGMVRGSEMRQTRGKVRREQLIDAAHALLDELPLETLSLAQIAQAADMPTSSAYHFFENAHGVLAALAERFGAELVDAVAAPYPGHATNTWMGIYAEAVDRAVALYRASPAYRQLILGPHTPPAIKLSDRKNDFELGSRFLSVIDQHFVLPEVPDLAERMFYSIEIVDLFLSLSYIRDREIRQDMVQEAKEAGIAYLERYLPRILPHRR